MILARSHLRLAVKRRNTKEGSRSNPPWSFFGLRKLQLFDTPLRIVVVNLAPELSVQPIEPIAWNAGNHRIHAGDRRAGRDGKEVWC